MAGDDLAPYFLLEVGSAGRDVALESDISQFIHSVEFESSLDMADLGVIRINNPGAIASPSDNTAPPDWVAHRAFQPGNEFNVLIGYGASAPQFVGRFHIGKHLPHYPLDDIPFLEVKGYAKSYLMMNASGNISGANLIPRLDRSRPAGEQDDQGQSFSNTRHSDVVLAIARMYGFEPDVDPTDRPEEIILKKGMNHYEIVKSLANINDKEFFVDYDYTHRRWVLHWKNPARDERAQYTFRYGDGDASTLLTFDPEYGLKDQITDITILIFDARNQRWVSAGLFNLEEGPDPRFQEGSGLRARSQSTSRSARTAGARAEARRADAVVQEAFRNPGAFRIAAGGVAIDVLPPGERFRDVEEASRFMLRWFQARRDNFLITKGTCVGVETLRARQVHKITGVSSRLDGDYYFISVRHKINPDDIYSCEFMAHKVVEDAVTS